MSTIAAVIARSGGPYSQPLKVKVITRGDVISYRGNDGNSRQSLSVAVTDGSTCCKLVCYDQSKFTRLVENQCVVLREVIIKKETPTYLVATRATKIFLTGGVTSNEDLVETCRQLIFPPAAPQIPIAKALTSPLKQKVSVRGKIVQEEHRKTVMVKGDEVALRSVTLEDASGRAKVTLWREAADVNVHPGDYVQVTDCVVNIFQNESGLNTTSRSSVEITDAPLEVCPYTVEAISVEDNLVELLTSDNQVVSVPADSLQELLQDDDTLETLTDNGPIKIKITRRGNAVFSVEYE